MINLSNADRILKQLYLSMVMQELNKVKEEPQKTEDMELDEKEENKKLEEKEEDETLAQRFN